MVIQHLREHPFFTEFALGRLGAVFRLVGHDIPLEEHAAAVATRSRLWAAMHMELVVFHGQIQLAELASRGFGAVHLMGEQLDHVKLLAAVPAQLYLVTLAFMLGQRLPWHREEADATRNSIRAGLLLVLFEICLGEPDEAVGTALVVGILALSFVPVQVGYGLLCKAETARMRATGTAVSRSVAAGNFLLTNGTVVVSQACTTARRFEVRERLRLNIDIDQRIFP